MRAVCRQKTNPMIGECGLLWRVKGGVYMLLYMLFEDWWGPHWRSGAGLSMEKVEKDHRGISVFGGYHFAKTICRDANLETGCRGLVMVALCNSI